MNDQPLSFAQIRALHWEKMVPQHAQDRYTLRKYRARVWMLENRQRIQVADTLRQIEDLQRCALFRRQGLA